ncbi:MAG: heavy-metal-associated domain-containing protein [Candidatus Marinimicrobia bacterium]|nr:heavy-metal-associated domain-containing protein [Candidatus Neomarinimicrobiota bacterium]
MMKYYKIALLSLILISATGILFAAAPANLSGDDDTKTCVIKVNGMTCSYCVKSVEKAMNKEAGVSSVTLDLSTGLATVTYDKDKTTPEKIAENVTKATYFESEVVTVVTKELSEEL